MRTDADALGGPRLVGVSAVVVGGLCGAILAVPDPGAEELRAAIRVTAFTSSVLFLLAFTASSWVRLRPSPAARWVRANRRYLGLSFAVSHTAHLLAIVALARRSPSFRSAVEPLTLVAGGLGFVVIALMAATSNDAAVRRLGRGWHLLHGVGVHYVWFIFVFTYVGPATISPFHAAMTLAFVAALGLRVAARRRVELDTSHDQ